MASMQEIAERLFESLERACGEHGAPNSFSFGELQAYSNGPNPRLAGKAFILIKDRTIQGHPLTVHNGRVFVSDTLSGGTRDPLTGRFIVASKDRGLHDLIKL